MSRVAVPQLECRQSRVSILTSHVCQCCHQRISCLLQTPGGMGIGKNYKATHDQPQQEESGRPHRRSSTRGQPYLMYIRCP